MIPLLKRYLVSLVLIATSLRLPQPGTVVPFFGFERERAWSTALYQKNGLYLIAMIIEVCALKPDAAWWQLRLFLLKPPIFPRGCIPMPTFSGTARI